jgi:hypothetical protein
VGGSGTGAAPVGPGAAFALEKEDDSTDPHFKKGKAMKRAAFIVTGLILLVGLCGSEGRTAPRKESVIDSLMKKKLTHSQKILEGIALQNFKEIASNAEDLIDISKQASFRGVLKTPEYELYSNEFRRIANKLVESAKKKNIDAAVLTYVDLTLNCVKCHKHVRDVRMARLD